MTTTVTIELSPEDLRDVMHTPDQLAREVRLAAALHWWSQGKLSLTKAARVAGISYREFLDEVATRKVVWPYDQVDLDNDLKTLAGE
jgi:predicted HTH domain antitoxin